MIPPGEGIENSGSMEVFTQKVICLLGPTGTGKSSLALALARAFRAEVVNFDSRQVYRDFPLITAQPGPEDRAVCRHWLYGFLETGTSLNAGRFTSLARERVADIDGRGGVSLLVGGTGLYLRSFLGGLAPIPEIPAAIRERILQLGRDKGPEVLHRSLKTCDPETARRVHPRDRQRLSRALEVYEATGRPLSWWHRQQPAADGEKRVLKLGIRSDLNSLAPRLGRRIEEMLALGAVDEVRRAWELCPDEQAPGWSGIGCGEILQYHLGRWSLEQAGEEWLRKTRAYAKRQLTWFQKEDTVHWFAPGDLEPARKRVRQWLATVEGGHRG